MRRGDDRIGAVPHLLGRSPRFLRAVGETLAWSASAVRCVVGGIFRRSDVDLEQTRRAIARMEDAAGIGQWSFDPRSKRLTCSAGMARLLGLAMPKVGWLYIEDHLALLHPDDAPSFRAFFAQARGDGALRPDGYCSRQLRLLRPDGGIRHVVVHGRWSSDRHGQWSIVDGFAVDVSDLVRSQQDLQQATTLMRSTIEYMDQGLIALGADQRVLLCNRRAAELFKLPGEVLHVGASIRDVVDFMAARGDYANQPNRLQDWIDAPAAVPDCYDRESPDGTTIEVRRKQLPDGGSVTTFTDATSRKRVEREVKESERRFRLLAENTNDVIILSDTNFRRLYVSPAIRAMLGYEPSEFVAMNVSASVHPDDHSSFELIRKDVDVAPEENFVTSARYRHKDGQWIWCEVSVRLVRDFARDSAMRYVQTLRDITSRKEAESQIRHLAQHDPLTGLANRALLHDRLRTAIARCARSGNPCVVLACDLDRFKTVNDTLGHPAGDALLRIVTSRMQNTLRHGDMVARLGGDEFAVVLEDIGDPLAARDVADRLIEAVGDPMVLDGQRIEIGISIGVAIAKGEIGSDELFKQADIALYQAKAAGRNTCRLYEAGAHMVATARGQLALDMREAMRNGDFRLVYQPIIDVATRRVGSFEALMRWRHPLRGDIAPGTFVEVAEETGMIVQLGAWAVREACRTAASLPAGMRIAVNVSAAQFRRPGFEDIVISALGQHRLSPSRLKLEVTESVLLEDSEAVLGCLHRLRKLGIRIALDDFGTGYSSLRYLRRFPFDTIKIDGSFVHEIANPDTAAIIRAIVSIGERLGIGVTAEGVETKDQLDRLTQEGCTAAQGYLFSPPLELADAQAYAQAAKAIAA